MADRTSIERIAKILARANSDSAGESEIALRGAYARMNRDSVTFTDLLTLSERDLYQDALVRLAEHIVKEQDDLSLSQKRTLYAEYLKRIVEKFPGDAQGRGESTSSNQDHAEQARQRERNEAARAYEQRRRKEEARRGGGEPPPKQEQQNREPPPKQESEKPFRRTNANTAKNGIQFPLNFDPERFPLSFSGGALFLFFFGAGSFIGCVYSFPKLALKLIFTSILVGGLTAGAIYIGLLLIYDWSRLEVLAYFWRILFQGTALGFILSILVTAFVFYERGWYPRGPRHGETDVLSIAKSIWHLVLGVIWRIYGVGMLVVNGVYRIAQRWRESRRRGSGS